MPDTKCTSSYSSRELFRMFISRFRKLVEPTPFSDRFHLVRTKETTRREEEEGQRRKETEENGSKEKVAESKVIPVLRGGAKQFDSHPGLVQQISGIRLAKLPVTAFREKRSCKEKLRARADKKEAQLVSSRAVSRRNRASCARSPVPLRRDSTSFHNAGPSLTWDLFFGEVKLSFISSGCNEAASLVGASNQQQKLPWRWWLASAARFSDSLHGLPFRGCSPNRG